MRTRERFTRKQLKDKEDFLNHTPTTNIIKEILAATPKRGVLVDVLVTPEIARDILTINTANRHPDQNTVDGYTRMMVGNKWIFTGDMIKITKGKKLEDMSVIDAQQRLMAVVKSGKAQEMHIQTGLDKSAFAVLDSGRRRTAADALALEGLVHVNTLAAAIKAEIYFKESRKVASKMFAAHATPQRVIDWKDSNDMALMVECVNHARNVLWPKGKFLAQSTWAFLYYTFSQIPGAKEDAISFLTKLSTGEGLSASNTTSPVYFLRERLQDLYKERKVDHKIIHELKVRCTITAWNLFRQRKKVQKLAVDTKTIELPQPI